MKLSLMLQKHFAAAQDGLASNFGDGYLMQHVGVFKNVRKKALSLGFSFSNSPDANYLAFPMSQLESILSSKTIPFTDNVMALAALNEKAPALDWDHIVDNLKPNFVFHESCHAVARTLSQPFGSPDLQTKLTTMLIEESFANACEFFSIADAGEAACRHFLEVNSYFTDFEHRTLLKKAIEKSGGPVVFKVLLLGYVHANFLNEKIADSDFKQLAAICEAPPSESAALKSLIKNCFNLNPRFRYTTTELYLRVNGVNMPVEQALDFDYLQLVKSNSTLLDLINSLSQIAGVHFER